MLLMIDNYDSFTYATNVRLRVGGGELPLYSCPVIGGMVWCLDAQARTVVGFQA